MTRRFPEEIWQRFAIINALPAFCQKAAETSSLPRKRLSQIAVGAFSDTGRYDRTPNFRNLLCAAQRGAAQLFNARGSVPLALPRTALVKMMAIGQKEKPRSPVKTRAGFHHFDAAGAVSPLRAILNLAGFLFPRKFPCLTKQRLLAGKARCADGG